MPTVAEVFVETLETLGVRYIFGVPSGNWVDYLDAIETSENLEFILVSHEGAAGFMADVCWRLTGQLAACFGTFGPGACNLSTGVCGGYLDRSPMLVFTDEMNDRMRNRICQMNIDHQALFKPITKWSSRISNGSIRATLQKAHHIAVAEVPGPVHIGLPAGIGADIAVAEDVVSPEIPSPIPAPDSAALEKMTDLFQSSRKPVAVLGISALRADSRDAVLDFLQKYRVPAVLTPMAKGLVPEDHPCYAGVLAHAMGNLVGEIHQQADLVLGIGYDPVEINYEDWIPDVPVAHIDTRPADLDTGNFRLGCDVVGSLDDALQFMRHMDVPARDWDLEELARHREALFRTFKAPEDAFGPRMVLEVLREILPRNGIMTCDVGAHLHLIGQQWQTGDPECQLMTNGCSSMGFGIPAAIAAKLVAPQRPVCCVTGDGGFYMMAGEMATAMRLERPVVFILITDAHLSLIRIKQERKGYGRYGTGLQSTTGGYRSSDTIFGVPVYAAGDAETYKKVLKEAFEAKGPVIIEAMVDTEEYDELVLQGNR